MGFADAVVACLRGFATFRGRARRREYWWFQLFGSLVWAVTLLVAVPLWFAAFEGEARPSEDPAIVPDSVSWGLLTLAAGLMLAYVVGIGVPTVAVTARRLHDLDQPAWWLLAIPLGLGIVLLVMALLPGQPGANRFGPDPRVAASRHSDVIPG
ncbi:DUF805 domain-containing protein [Demequina iriomotensis]|uniref:DUF805 domain-containing protein n=1 Tax=Demequina iriomotensis TaxID=1536641 RepID=UPI0007834EE7|nr:DUF805 domain-containing protein [Demequina iriomotensis]